MSSNEEILQQIALLAGAINRHHLAANNPKQRVQHNNTLTTWVNPHLARQSQTYVRPPTTAVPTIVRKTTSAPIVASSKSFPPSSTSSKPANTAYYRPSRNMTLINNGSNEGGSQAAPKAVQVPSKVDVVQSAPSQNSTSAAKPEAFVRTGNKLVRLGSGTVSSELLSSSEGRMWLVKSRVFGLFGYS
ncbi:hypothetical protein HK102_005805 [Quaeritorhiza haematococci]|nr:hypothetical protein HK102_005805 [Quaeritorhiza haematococci]